MKTKLLVLPRRIVLRLMFVVLVVGALQGKGQTPYAELSFKGITKDTFTVSKDWFNTLSSIAVTNPNYHVESFRISTGCGDSEYSEYASESNRFTSEMKWLMGRLKSGCKLYLGMFVVKDKGGYSIPLKYRNYVIYVK